MGCCDETTARVPDTDVSRRTLFKGAGLIASAWLTGPAACPSKTPPRAGHGRPEVIMELRW